jgi:CDGSH-type Zn-finger protein
LKQQDNLTKSTKSKILPLPNGPFYLFHDMQPKVVENLQNSKGEPLSNVRGVALCRCGASKNKLFCDGTHSMINFSTVDDNNKENNNHDDKKDTSKNKKKSYLGQNITIYGDRTICSHAAYCVGNLSSVFKVGHRSWKNADNASIEEIIETIKKWTSNALSYSIDGTGYNEMEGREPMITVSKDGAYLIIGGEELVGAKQIPKSSSKEHYAFCRCWASNNKPFCDGSHNKINFKDDKN